MTHHSHLNDLVDVKVRYPDALLLHPLLRRKPDKPLSRMMYSEEPTVRQPNSLHSHAQPLELHDPTHDLPHPFSETPFELDIQNPSMLLQPLPLLPSFRACLLPTFCRWRGSGIWEQRRRMIGLDRRKWRSCSKCTCSRRSTISRSVLLSERRECSLCTLASSIARARHDIALSMGRTGYSLLERRSEATNGLQSRPCLVRLDVHSSWVNLPVNTSLPSWIARQGKSLISDKVA